MYVWKTVKIFISSTFRDLELERDDLVKLFVSLQKKFYAKKIAIIPYDLRWQQRHDDENIVQWCLEKIEECQYFIGILGNRYGWRPPEKQKGVANVENYSITEMEIRHSQEVIEPNNRIYLLDGRNWSPENCQEKEEDLASLQKLKQYLNNENTFCYDDSQKIISIIEEEITKILERDYPSVVEFAETSLTDARKEIIAEKVSCFVGREKYLDKLRNFAADNDDKNYLCVCAVAGTGKSSLAAYFVQETLEKNTTPIVWHYMSMSANAGEPAEILQSLYEQMINLEIIVKEEEPPETLMELFEKVQQKLIVVLDGLDELKGKVLDLKWLPKKLPSYIRIIITTRPVTPWENLQKISQLSSFELPPLDEKEIFTLVNTYEEKQKFSLSESEKQILMKRAAGSPLFLKVAFDEMLSHGVAVGQLAESIDKLFSQSLERLEKRYGQTIIEKYLGIIAGSRSGLAENEINELIHSDEKEQKISDDFVLSLQKSLANFIVKRNHLYNFFHPEFERTIKMRLGKSKIRHYHQVLAEYLKQKGFSYERTCYELPYHLQWGELYEELLALLSNKNFLEQKSSMMEDLLFDLERTLFETAVPIPDIKIQNTLGTVTDKSLIKDIYRIIQQFLPFLRRQPQTLFQCMWNLGYWTSEEKSIRSFVIAWEKNKNKNYWLKSLKSPQAPLDSPLEKNLRFHFGRIHDVAFAHDGETLVSAGGLYDMKIRMWNTFTGECFQTFAGHSGAVTKVRYSYNDKQIISASRDCTVKIWDAETADCITTIEVENDKLEALDVFHTTFAYGGRDSNVYLWDWEKGEKITILKKHDDCIKSIAFSSCGNYLISAARDGYIYLWDLKTFNVIQSFKHDAEVWCVVFHPKEKTIISSSRDQSIRVWCTSTGKCLKVILGHTGGGVNTVAISPDGKLIVSGGEDKLARVWDYQTGQQLHAFSGHQSRVIGSAFSPKENKFASSSKDKSICIWNLDNPGSITNSNEHKDKISQIVWHEEKIISASWDGTVKVWNSSGMLQKTLEGPKGRLTTLAYSPQTEFIAAAGSDKLIYLWNQDSFVPTILKGHKRGVNHICFDRAGKQILSSSNDKTIVLWDIEEQKKIQTFTDHSDWVQKAIFSPSEEVIASCGKDNTVRLWDKGGECLTVFAEHKDWIRDIDFSSDGKLLASASKDKTVRIWDTINHKCLLVLKGHKRNVQEVRFSQDAKHLVTWSWEGVVCIWETSTGKEIHRMRGKSHIDHILDNTTFRVVSSNLRTIIIDKNTDEIVAWLPQTIDLTAINNYNTIFGSTGSGYLPIFKLEK